MEAATRAIELEPRSAEGHTALACAKLIYDNDRAGARQAFERALELNPSYGQGRCWYALFYLQWACGELDRGLAEARRALEADPLSAYTMMIVSACLATAEQFDDAIETAALSVRTDPDSFVARWELGVAQTHGGHLDDAIDTLRQAAAMSNGHVFATASLGSVLAALGRHEEAAEVHRELLARAAQRYVPAAFLALTADAAGDRDQAVAHARRAWSDREPPFILLARQMIVFKSLREDSRFQEILREMDAGPA
jgi:adenylate cyclase